MAGEDLLEDDTGDGTKKKHKPLSKGQKIGVAIGVVTIILFIYEIEKNKSNAAAAVTTTTPIDPQTGYPEGSAQDQAALAQLGGAGATPGYSTGSDGGYYSPSNPDPTAGIDPSTGQSYSSELTTLGTDFQSLQNSYSTLSQQVATWSSTGTPTTNPTVPTLSSAQTSTLAKLNQELGKDQAAKKPNTKAITILKRQISAVQHRGT
jgi:hypothetical protein